MKKILIFLFSCSAIITANGQVAEQEAMAKKIKVSKDTVEGWKRFGDFTLAGSQTSLTNWNAGGQNSIAINSLFNYNINLKKGAMTWENRLTLGYGIMRQGRKNASWIKTDDRIELFSKVGRKASENWYYAGVAGFSTQMTPGYAYPNDSVVISRFMAPGYLLATLGMDYRPHDNFSLYIAPVAGKFTFVNDADLANAGAFGVDRAIIAADGTVLTPGSRFRAELGAYLRAQFKTDLTETISFSTSLGLFSNYLENPERIDVNWETMTLINLWKNKLILGLSTHLIYDDDIDISVDSDADGIVEGFGPRIQFKEVFNLGLTFKF